MPPVASCAAGPRPHSLSSPQGFLVFSVGVLASLHLGSFLFSINSVWNIFIYIYFSKSEIIRESQSTAQVRVPGACPGGGLCGARG